MSIVFVDDIGRWIEQQYKGRGFGAVYQPAAGAGAFLADVATGFDLIYVDPPFNLAAEPDVITMNLDCRICKQPTQLTVRRDGWERRCNGEPVQDALPELSRADRELLISGTCGNCFAAILKGWGFDAADAGEE